MSGLKEANHRPTKDFVPSNGRLMTERTGHFYEFGPFRLNARQHLLLRNGKVVPLPPKAIDLLVALVENGGKVLDKEELMKQVWPDSFVEEANLSHHVFRLRKALDEGGDANKYIETIPRRGYRFVAGVTEVRDESDELVVAEHSRSRIVIEQTESPNLAADYPGSDRTGRILALAAGTRRRTVLLALGCAGTLVLAVAFYFWKTGNTVGEPTSTGVKSIAVLPFKPLVVHSRNESLETGMAETLITKLSGITRLIVRPLSAIRKYTGLEQDSIVAGRELGVDYVLEGNLQMEGEKTRATVRLLRVNDGTAIWTDKCDQQCSTIFELQDSVVQQIAGALALQLTGKEKKQLAKHYTENVDAYQLYVKGRFFWNKFTDETVTKSIDYFKQAIDKDPTYALAYAGLADSYNVLGSNGPMSSKDALPKVRYAAEKAIELDDNLAESHLALGAFKLFYQWDWPGAERAFKRAIELDPSYAVPHELYGYRLRIMGEFDEALAEMRKAQELDPISLLISDDLGVTLRLARRYDQAIEAFEKTLELDPNFADSRCEFGLAYGFKGMHERAIAEITKAVTLSGNNAQIIARLGEMYALAGNKVEAHRIIDRLQAESNKRYSPPLHIAMIYATLGEDDKAFTWLEKAYDEHSTWLINLNVEASWDKIRSDPRFYNLLGRVGLPK